MEKSFLKSIDGIDFVGVWVGAVVGTTMGFHRGNFVCSTSNNNKPNVQISYLCTEQTGR